VGVSPSAAGSKASPAAKIAGVRARRGFIERLLVPTAAGRRIIRGSPGAVPRWADGVAGRVIRHVKRNLHDAETSEKILSTWRRDVC